MFEISVACKYLLPRRRQLSVSIISLISVLVISLVVWLVVVFFSVTEGLERNWVNKLIALTAPIRATPTEAYYRSYYHLIDGISEESEYSTKTIDEKRQSLITDPYSPEIDQEIPVYWTKPDLDVNGDLKDIVKLFFSAVDSIEDIPGLYANDYEVTGTQLSINPFRPSLINQSEKSNPSSLVYQTYLTNFEKENKELSQTLLPPRAADLNNLLLLIRREERLNPLKMHERLTDFFKSVTIISLKPQPKGWKLPPFLLPKKFQWKVILILKNGKPFQAFVPDKAELISSYEKELQMSGFSTEEALLSKEEDSLRLIRTNQQLSHLPSKFPLLLPSDVAFQAELQDLPKPESASSSDLLFSIELSIQNHSLNGVVPFNGLQIAEVKMHSPTSLLEELKNSEKGILLPKTFKDSGILVGDHGFLSYIAPTTSVVEEQKIPIQVAGFYDPGIIPIGGKFILANREITRLIHSSHTTDEKIGLTNGINIRLQKIEQVEKVKQRLQKALKAAEIDRYWNIQTYRDYEFTKEIIQELQSQKNLFSLIAIVIIIIACSNIISMLVILVNDKKTEIGILRSMGATSASIATIFALSGAFIGMIGSFLGILAGIITLHYIQEVSSFLSYLQGYEMFNTSLYGELLPNKLSFEALLLVLGVTIFLSFIAGIVPAIKASLLRPSQIFRSSGS